ncbi:MAG: hypothetical protein IJ831_11515 [Spirochaetales bacterium]|nr:hypothetical protein [Spirochaetales bacterium]
MKRALSSRQFVRTFLTVLGISLLILFVQLVGIFTAGYVMSTSWPRYVTREYMNTLHSDILEEDEISVEMIMNTALKAIEGGGVSGLIYHDPAYSKIMFFGTTPRGDFHGSDISTVSELRSYKGIDPEKLESGNKKLYISTYEIFHKETSIDLVYSDELDFRREEVRVPERVNPRDVSGRIRISLDGEVVLIIDVLVKTLGFYGPTRFFLDHLTVMLISILLLAVVIAAISSFVYSARTTRKIEELKETVSALSHGRFDVEFKKTGVYELDEIGDALRVLAGNLETNRRNRQEWLISIGHDLNTPITSINLLLDGAKDGIFPLDQSLVSSLRKECDVLTSRVDSVRYYSFISSPDLVLERSDMSTFDLVDGAISSMKEKCSGIRLEIDENEVVNVDGKLAARAIREVVANACMASPEGPVTIRSNGSIITVTNPGRLPSPAPQFFEPWSRGDLSRHEGGSGMGLPITGKILELHGGSARIEEKDGLVTVTLDFTQAGS